MRSPTLNEAIARAPRRPATSATTCCGSGTALRARSAQGRRLLRLRRRDGAAREPRRQARHRARQAAAAGASQGLFGQPTRHQQRDHAAPACRSSWRAARSVLPRLRRRAARAARCRSSWPATSSTAAWSRRPFGVTLRELLYDFGGGSRIGPADQGGAGGRPAGRLPARIAVGHAARLRGLRGGRRARSATAASWCTTTRPTWPQLARYAMEFCAIESCGKCTPCRIGSTRGVEVIDKIRADQNRRAAGRCCCATCATRWSHGSLCAMGGMTPVPGAVGARTISRKTSACRARRRARAA